MKYNEIIVEKREYEMLKQLITNTQYSTDKTYKASIEKLSGELKSAKITAKEEMPDEIVRFNSIVTIKIPNGDEKTFQIVTPEKSDISMNKLSILAPMGLALFGYAVGDEFLWQFPTGMSKIKIQKVNQVDETQKIN